MLREYVEAIAGIARHRRMGARVTLTELVTLHRVLMSVMGRLADYAGMFERDLYFAMLGCLATERSEAAKVLNPAGQDKLSSGQIIDALRTLPDYRYKQAASRDGPQVAATIKELFGKNVAELHAFRSRQTNETTRTSENPRGPDVDEHAKFESLIAIRNDLSHLNSLNSDSYTLDLTALVNQTRTLMSYDRKLKNAVSQSIKELLLRQSIRLKWGTTDRHELADAKIAGKMAKHLGGRKLHLQTGDKPEVISENLCSEHHLKAVAKLFAGKADIASDVADLDLNTVDWATPNEKGKGSQHAPSPGRPGSPKAPRR